MRRAGGKAGGLYGRKALHYLRKWDGCASDRADGGGLYLQVSASGAKSWVFRFALHTQKREMGLGSAIDIPLKKAREMAAEYRALVREGVDPIAYRVEQRAQYQVDASMLVPFKTYAETFIKNNAPSWKNTKHAQQWTNTLKTYAEPVIGTLPVALIETHHILDIIRPIWSSKNETARRVRGRIETILDAAKVEKLREGENPARWKGHLDKILPNPSKIQKVKHHSALPYQEIGQFISALHQQSSVASYGLEFLILTACRTGEVLDARFDEIDLHNKIWTIPADRMKGGKEHRVPLSDRAIEIIDHMQSLRDNDYLFPGQRGKGLSNMVFLQLLKRMGHTDITAHGFRSTFRDWTAEQTSLASLNCGG